VLADLPGGSLQGFRVLDGALYFGAHAGMERVDVARLPLPAAPQAP
jgi:hypothetical protein